MTALDILQKYWKHPSFRKSQEEIIQNVLNKKDVIAILPTGGGKSICYQIPALLNDGVCIVISPLISLMQDQVNNLNKKEIKAIAITSKLTEHEIIVAFDNIRFGQIKFLYLSPEKLQSEFIQQKIKQLNVNLIAIDEAHCISQWGHDFRPSYLDLNILREIHPKTPFIALTATATKQVTSDISSLLKFENPIIFKESFERKNLAYQVFETEDIYHKLKRILTKIKAPTIIYVNTRNRTKEVSDYLNSIGYYSTFYHGGLALPQKELAFSDWMSEKKRIIVATNAFGMGIDKENVKIVIHLEIPNSIENYVQEAGRAGRNGKKAFSVVLYNQSIIYNFKKTILKNINEIEYIKEIYKHLNQHLQIAKGELTDRKYLFNLQDFCNKYKLNTYKTYNALQILEKESILTYTQNLNKSSKIRFIIDNEQVLNYTKKHPKYRNIIQLILRSYGGIFENNTNINEHYLSSKLKTKKSIITNTLKQIEKDRIIQYSNYSNTTEIQFLVMREDQITINNISRSIHQRNTIKQKKADAILNYITNNTKCRNIILHEYFEEVITINCGICDVCIKEKNKKVNLKSVTEKILSLLSHNEEISSKEMVVLLNIKEENLIASLKILLEMNKIKLTQTNSYKKL